MEACPAPCLMVVMIGIPGSGKSTLAKLLSQGLRERQLEVYHVEFDEVHEACAGEVFDPAVWKAAQSDTFRKVEAILHAHNRPKACVIFVDDNMQYRSMREPYYRLARDSGRAAYAQLHVGSSLQDALSRNRERDAMRRVQDDVIQRMYAQLEAPLLQPLSWESNSVSATLGSADPSLLVQQLLDLWGPAPPVPASIDLQLRDQDRQANCTNQLHALDLATRAMLQSAMTKLKHSGHADKARAQKLNAKRREVVQGVQESSQHLVLSDQCQEAKATFAAFCEDAILSATK